MKVTPGLRRVTALALAALALTVGGVVPDATPATAGPVDLGAGGEFHPLTPARIYDSRPSSAVNEPNPGPKPATPAEPTFDIQLLGQGGVPADPAQVLAVAVNIVVTEPTGDGWLNAYATGAAAGTAASLTYVPGRTVPNLAIVRPGAGGKLTIKLFATTTAQAHVVVDVFGWYSTSDANAPRGERLITVSPGRLYDSNQFGGNFGAAESRRVLVRDVIASNGQYIPREATAVVLNIASDRSKSTTPCESFVSAVPEQPVGMPGTANLNVYPGQTKANTVMVQVGSDSHIWLYNNCGSARLVVDVLGYYIDVADGTTQGGRVVPLSVPFRLWDTREPAFGAARLGAGQAEDWGFGAFVNSVQIGGVSGVAQGAVIGNLTAASLIRQYPSVPVYSTYMSAWPADAPQPFSAVLNVPEGFEATPNLTVLTYSALKTVRMYNANGSVHYVFDASAVVLAD